MSKVSANLYEKIILNEMQLKCNPPKTPYHYIVDLKQSQ
jgi:hypothetical protein